MAHIISDQEYRELTAWRASGLTPERAMDLVADEEAPLPLPLWAEDKQDDNMEINERTTGGTSIEHQVQY